MCVCTFKVRRPRIIIYIIILLLCLNAFFFSSPLSSSYTHLNLIRYYYSVLVLLIYHTQYYYYMHISILYSVHGPSRSGDGGESLFLRSTRRRRVDDVSGKHNRTHMHDICIPASYPWNTNTAARRRREVRHSVVLDCHLSSLFVITGITLNSVIIIISRFNCTI